MELKLDISNSRINEEELAEYSAKLEAADAALKLGKEGFTGWTTLPRDYDSEEFERVIKAAERIRDICDALIVIGIGGSYLGAKACIEMMGHSFGNLLSRDDRKAPQIFFAGQNLSAVYHSELLDVVKGKDVCLCVISKSGTTTESNIAFSVLKEELYRKYGRAEGRKRIFAITDASKGTLREETEREGYESFIIPDDVGGRYSVLTPVGLLPVAAAGIDIREIMRGARDGMDCYAGTDVANNLCCKYAAVRDILSEKGKKIEIYECYEPKLYYFAEWMKQLFGESEGKDGKGVFPALLQFTTDLHSMGQFIQEGSQLFFETVLNVEAPDMDIEIPASAAPAFRGKTMNQVNQAAVKGVIAAHAADNIPVISINIPELTPYFFGKMVYFFERSCALRGYIMGVNPFNQPGVEKYKAYMKEALNE